MFLASVIALMQAMRSAVPTIWSINPPGTVLRWGAGYVDQMPAVTIPPMSRLNVVPEDVELEGPRYRRNT